MSGDSGLSTSSEAEPFHPELRDFRKEERRLYALFTQTVRLIGQATAAGSRLPLSEMEAAHAGAVNYFEYYDRFALDYPFSRHVSPEWRYGFAIECYRTLDRIANYYDAIVSYSKRQGIQLDALTLDPFAYSNLQKLVRVELPEHAAKLKEVYDRLGLPTHGWIDRGAQPNMPDSEEDKHTPVADGLTDLDKIELKKALARTQLRERVQRLFLTDVDLDAFCLDYFPSVRQRFVSGMDLKQRVSLLLTYIKQELLTASMDQYEAFQAAAAAPVHLAPVVSLIST